MLLIDDLNEPNLFIGKEIGTSSLKGKIISFDDNNIKMKIITLHDELYERYFDLNEVYPLFKHTYWTGNLLLWEVNPESMKRQYSQILLQWEKDIGWTWDLDS
jgi:hypothetical protein